MSTNEQLVLEKYSDASYEDGRADRPSSLPEFYYTKRHLDGLITPDSRVLEVGCATGHYGMYYAGKCREYVGIDIVPSQIDRFCEKVAEAGIKNVTCSVGDATDLSGIADGSFDVVLCLGPMYHLPPEERSKAASECARVTKHGGITAFAYINIVGTYAGACVIFPDYYPSEAANATLVTGTDDLQPGLFWYASPDEMESLAAQNRLTKVKHLATDFMFMRSVVERQDEAGLDRLRPLYDAMTSDERCVGLAGHALIVGRRE